MSPLIKFGFQLFNNSRRSFALLRGTLKLVAQFSGSVGTLGMFGNWANLIWPSMFGISERKRATANKKPQFFRDARPPREQFCLNSDPWVRQFLAMRRTQTHGGVFDFIQQTQEFADVPELVPQSICQFRDPPYLNALPPKSFVAPLDATHNYCCSRPWHYKTAEAVQLIQTGLGHANVYALLLPSRDVDQDVKRSPLIHGYSWKQSEKSNSRAVILPLTKHVVAFTLDSTSRSVQ
jgi:hypothetical protein